jgi:hypothetical protein
MTAFTPLREAAAEPRLPPANTEAEQGLLGTLLINNAAHIQVAELLRPDHFVNEVHGRIYAAIGEFIRGGVVADPVTLKTRFDRDGALSDIGGAKYLARLAACAVTAINAESYARSIVDAARRRAIIAAGLDMVDAGYAAADLNGALADVLRRCGDAAASPLSAGAHLHDERLIETLDIATWSALDIPPEPKLLGDLLTPTARVFLVGRTGLGKTLLVYGLCAGMATGLGFCHWRCERPSRWLIIDGEMPTVLIRQRSGDVLRRAGPVPAGYLTIYSMDRAEEFARLFPGLGMLAPLNTEDGQRFVLRLVELVKPEGIAFDNTMSLVPGDQKDEVPWSGALSLVSELTKQGIAQIWLDHAGHNTDRQYGSSTKQWRMDAVGMMTPLAADQSREPGEAAFNLSFEPPAGKARRQTPENLGDFANVIIRLTDDQWTSEPAAGAAAAGRLTPKCQLWHLALLDALSRSAQLGRSTRTEWYGEAVRTGLAAALDPEGGWQDRNRKMGELRKYIAEMRIKGFIGVDGETVIYLRKSTP